MGESDPYLVPGLVRGLAFLQAFTPQRPELTVTQLAAAHGISRSAAFRTVHTLVEEGFLLPVRGGPLFRLGPAVLRLSYGYLASRELLEVAHSPLEQLRDGLDWSIHLGVLDGRHVLYLIRLPASDGLSSLVHVGSRLPAARTAMGRVLLAGLSEAGLGKLLADRPERERHEALAARANDRRTGHVVHLGQFESGLCSVAAPVFDMSGAGVAAISATKSGETVPAQVIEEVLQAAEKISRGMGWRQDREP